MHWIWIMWGRCLNHLWQLKSLGKQVTTGTGDCLREGPAARLHGCRQNEGSGDGQGAGGRGWEIYAATVTEHHLDSRMETGRGELRGAGNGRQKHRENYAAALTEHHLDSVIKNRFRGPRHRRRVLSSPEQQFSLIPVYHASSKTPLRRSIVSPPVDAPVRLSVCPSAYIFSASLILCRHCPFLRLLLFLLPSSISSFLQPFILYIILYTLSA